jgi:CubicO group peptidase (beta-lactamase class C family)
VAGLEGAFERIGAFLEHELPLTHAAGAALAVTDRDEVLGVVVRGFADVASSAPVRPETRFEIGSISKSFAAIVALQEVEAGRLDLHVSVNALLPELEIPEPFGPITLHHLLTHSGGLAVGTEEAPTGPGAVRRLRDAAPGFPPGEHFFYSNDGYKAVGAILERLAGQPIHEILRDRVLAPLGMGSTVAAITNDVRTDIATGYEPMFDERPPHTSHPLVPARWLVSNTADGSIVSNVIDMSSYARMLLNGGASPTGRLLSERSFSMLSARHMDTSDEPGWGYGYGLDVADLDGRSFIGHSGGMVGYTAYLLTEPGSGLGAMLMLNGMGARQAPVRFALDAVRAALAGEPPPEVPEPPDPSLVADAAGYAGAFRSDAGREVQIAAEDGRLRWREGALGVILERVAETGDAFFAPHQSLDRFLVHFGRDADGRVVEILHGNDWLRGERWSGPDPDPHPEAWAAYPGLYRSNNPWGPTVRVLLRKGTLVVVWSSDLEAQEQELVPREDGRFHVGSDLWTPAWIAFDQPMNGVMVRATLDGGVWYRSFED